MTLKNVVSKSFGILYEETKEKTKSGLALKVFYNIDINIKNNGKSEKLKQEQEADKQKPAEIQQTDTPTAGTAAPGGGGAGMTPPPPPSPAPAPTETPPPASVQTEADEAEQKADQKPSDPNPTLSNGNEKITTENQIVRKTKGILSLSSDEVDRTQSIDDLLSILQAKEDDQGNNVLDDFTFELLSTLMSPNAAKAGQLISKDDGVFVELNYGKKLEQDSVGVRINKRRSSDRVSISMLSDSNLVESSFSLKRLNDRIVQIRNIYIGKKD
jgi:hypothetical protein